MSTNTTLRTTVEPLAATWTHRASLYGGTVAAIVATPTWADDRTFFAATMAGLFRSEDAGRTWTRAAQGLVGLSLAGLAVSPMWNEDRTVLTASIDGNIFRVVFGDGEPRWTPANLRGRQVSVSALAISPAFNRDGMAFAATIGDGVLRSRDRGLTWDAWNFGLLDLEVLALAMSPDFAEDETIFAATATGIFRSPNAGRAWRELQFPEDAGAVLCLALSPSFATDQTIFAGTEEGNIYRSTDGGRRWKQLRSPFEGEFLNVLQVSPRFATDKTVIALTEAALYTSTDSGQHWERTGATPGAMSLGLPPTYGQDNVVVLAGLAQDGVLRASGSLDDFEPSNEGLGGRLLIGLTDSEDGILMATWGPSEGVLVSTDAGATWDDRTGNLPSVEVNDVLIAGGRLLAAMPNGVYVSAGDGQWSQLTDLSAHQLRAAGSNASEMALFAATRDRGLWRSDDGGANWELVEGFASTQEILGIAVSPHFSSDRAILVAAREMDGSVSLLLGQGGEWTKVLTHPEAALGALLVACAVGDEVQWFAALDTIVYGPLRPGTEIEGTPVAADHPRVVGFGSVGPAGRLLAATEAGLFASDDAGATWRPITGEPTRSVVALASTAARDQPSTILCLGLGGDIWSLGF